MPPISYAHHRFPPHLISHHTLRTFRAEGGGGGVRSAARRPPLCAGQVTVKKPISPLPPVELNLGGGEPPEMMEIVATQMCVAKGGRPSDRRPCRDADSGSPRQRGARHALTAAWRAVRPSWAPMGGYREAPPPPNASSEQRR